MIAFHRLRPASIVAGLRLATGAIGLMLALGPLDPGVPAAFAVGAPYCRLGEVPAFHYGFAEMKAQLGTGMGEPEQCEHIDGGETVQFTTTGIGFYTPSTNLVVFDVMWGSRFFKWALAPDGLLFWEGESYTPPLDAPTVSDQICAATDFSSPTSEAIAAACSALTITELGPQQTR